MDESETLALKYLQSQGFINIKFEPDGNRPPDFLVDDTIAVEVRRLNQNFEYTFGKRGLEEEAKVNIGVEL
jgi:hypothetical protein